MKCLDDGVITIDEFVQSMTANATKEDEHEHQGKYSQDELVAQFNMFDKVRLRSKHMIDIEFSNTHSLCLQNGDGFIEREEMVSIVRELALDASFPVTVIDSLFREADVDGDGRISLPGACVLTLRNSQLYLSILEFIAAMN